MDNAAFAQALLQEIARERARILGERNARPGPIILVVDDDTGLQMSLQALLQSEGFAVDTAGNGHEALESIGRRRPDVVLSDVRMPVMDGHVLRERLSMDPATAGLDVVMMSGASDRLAGVECLMKPLDPTLLIALMRERTQSRASA